MYISVYFHIHIHIYTFYIDMYSTVQTCLRIISYFMNLALVTASHLYSIHKQLPPYSLLHRRKSVLMIYYYMRKLT